MRDFIAKILEIFKRNSLKISKIATPLPQLKNINQRGQTPLKKIQPAIRPSTAKRPSFEKNEKYKINSFLEPSVLNQPLPMKPFSAKPLNLIRKENSFSVEKTFNKKMQEKFVVHDTKNKNPETFDNSSPKPMIKFGGQNVFNKNKEKQRESLQVILSSKFSPQLQNGKIRRSLGDKAVEMESEKKKMEEEFLSDFLREKFERETQKEEKCLTEEIGSEKMLEENEPQFNGILSENSFKIQNEENIKKDLISPNTPNRILIDEIELTKPFGLKNVGNSCFFNSVLQCLSVTHEFTKFYLSDEIFKISKNNEFLMTEKKKRFSFLLKKKPKESLTQNTAFFQESRTINEQFKEFLLESRINSSKTYNPAALYNKVGAM